MIFTYTPRGTCSHGIVVEIDDLGNLKSAEFMGGCHGNLQGIALLADGRPAEELIDLLEGVQCGFKPTSCPDQFANALRNTLEEKALAELK